MKIQKRDVANKKFFTFKFIVCLVSSNELPPERVQEVMNSPIKFLTARRTLPLLDLLADLNECSLARAPQIFAVARMLAFLSVLFGIL